MLSNEIIERVRSLLSEGDTDAVDELVAAYPDTIDLDTVFRMAVRVGAMDYIITHLYDVEIDEDGQPYIDEASDSDIREILIGAHALRAEKGHSNARFYLDSESDILEIDEELADEGRARVLQLAGISFDAFVEKLQTRETANERMPEPLNAYTYGQVQAMADIADPFDYPDDIISPAKNRDIPVFYRILGFDVIEETGEVGSKISYIL